MNLLTLSDARVALVARFGQKAAQYPDHFAELIPMPASTGQSQGVQSAVQTLTGRSCSDDLTRLVSTWDFTHLNVAGFSFGYKGTLAERLVQNNRVDAVNAWWEDAFEQRPPTWLFVAQSDPYVLVLDAQNDAVHAYVDSEGPSTAVKVADRLSVCIRMLLSIQFYKPDAVSGPLTVSDVKDVVGQDCDTQFWAVQIAHWAQFN